MTEIFHWLGVATVIVLVWIGATLVVINIWWVIRRLRGWDQ